MAIWNELEGRLDSYTWDGNDFKKPRPEDLDRFEAENGLKLPDDYREFALGFGPGTFVGGWGFLTPGFPEDSRVDLGVFLKWWREAIGQDDPEARFVLFCEKEDFHGRWGWDPAVVTDPERHEYAIFLVGDHCPPIRVASGFKEFVLSYVLGGGFERQYYNDTDARGQLGEAGNVGYVQGPIDGYEG